MGAILRIGKERCYRLDHGTGPGLNPNSEERRGNPHARVESEHDYYDDYDDELAGVREG